MKIGLYNLEPKINNSAMMQVSYYHKNLGDDVEIYKQSNHDDYDKIYTFSIFDFTDKSTVTDDMVCCGTGFDIKSRLSKDNLDDKIDLLLNYIRPYKLMCYVLIGFWSTPEEDMNRVMHLVDKYKISPFVMPYNKFDPYQKKFARWVNNKAIFNKVAWEDFEI